MADVSRLVDVRSLFDGVQMAVKARAQVYWVFSFMAMRSRSW